ncbi:MAG: hypothetical protein AAGB00_06280 [Planctomycetota bacterium]
MAVAQSNATAAHLTREELADRYKVSIRTVDSAIAAGSVSVVRFGRAVRIPAVEVERLDREGFSL